MQGVVIYVPEEPAAGVLSDMLWDRNCDRSQHSVLDALRLRWDWFDHFGILYAVQKVLVISLSPGAYALAVTMG